MNHWQRRWSIKRPTERPGFKFQMPRKQTWELFGFAGLILFLAVTFLFHPYFQIRDIAISGLDAETNERVRGALSAILQAKTLGIRQDGYFLIRAPKIESAVRAAIAVDEISVKIIFPHSLAISVQEIPMRFRVSAANGTAYLAADGSVVRWYDSTSTAPIGGQAIIEMQTTDPVLNHKLRETIFDTTLTRAILEIAAAQFNIEPRGIEYLAYTVNNSERLEVRFKRGVTVNFTILETMDAQIKKAQLAMRAYATAKKIDVRFGDKAFVSLQ